jgi:hypothetical protein
MIKRKYASNDNELLKFISSENLIKCEIIPIKGFGKIFIGYYEE